jgi:trehalose/maltose hydrolase-like predicted phosphorylase
VPGFVYYKQRCTRLAAASDKVYQLLVNGRWISLGTPASSTTKTGRHDVAEILLKMVLNTKYQNIVASDQLTTASLFLKAVIYVDCVYHTASQSIRVAIFHLRHCKLYPNRRKPLGFHK